MQPWTEECTTREACGESVARLLALDPSLREQIPLAREVTALMSQGIADVPLGVEPPPSHASLGLDGTPIELSVRSDRTGHAVRWALEAAPDREPPEAARAAWHRAELLAEQLHERYGAPIEHLRALQDIYRGEGSTYTRYCFATAITARGPRFQAYFARAWPYDVQLRAAMDAFGALPFCERLLALLPPRAPVSFATDLTPRDDARAKVYVSALTYDPRELGAYRELAGELWPAEMDDVLREWFGSIPKPLLNPRGGVILCFHLRRGELTHVTMHAGMGCTEYELPDDRLLTDGELMENVSGTMRRFGIDPTFYRAAVSELAVEDLGGELGIHAYTSLLYEGGQPTITAYLSPRFYLQRFGFR